MSEAKEALRRIQAMQQSLKRRFHERDHVVDGLLTALIAGQHVLLLGPVGTGKSQLARDLTSGLKDATLFTWLMTKFSVPEELFGPIKLSGLENDRYERVTTKRLPQAHVAFLDEVFKSNSAILNALLSLMNERIFHNGTSADPVPLRMLIGASNELPEDEELLALYDRFAMRFIVNYIREDHRFLAMLSGKETADSDEPGLSLTDLEALSTARSEVKVPKSVLEDLLALRSSLRDVDIVPSDRRYKTALALLQAHALLHNQDSVSDANLVILGDILWTRPEEESTVRAIIAEHIQGHLAKARELLIQAREILDYTERDWGDAELAMRARIEAHTKLNRLRNQADALMKQCVERNRDTGEVESLVEEVEEIQRRVLEQTMRA